MELYRKNIENRALPSLHQKSLEITLTAPLNTTKVEVFVLVNPSRAIIQHCVVQ